MEREDQATATLPFRKECLRQRRANYNGASPISPRQSSKDGPASRLAFLYVFLLNREYSILSEKIFPWDGWVRPRVYEGLRSYMFFFCTLHRGFPWFMKV